MPHVMLIVVDALRADHLGCYAGSDLGTPTFDQLAREGALFTNAISQAPWTRPSVASIMTGLYPSQHGLVDRPTAGAAVTALDATVPTLPALLSAAGHPTAAFMAGNANLKPAFGITREFREAFWRPTNDGTVIVDEFERWVRDRGHEQFFCYLHFMDVHDPLPAEMVAARLDDGVDLRLVNKGVTELAALYSAAVRRADAHLGRVIGILDAQGILDDTLLIVTADHGEELMDHGAMLAHGRDLYRELVQVPLIVRLPGRAATGQKVGAPVQLIDLSPTILEYVGHPPVALPGQSLLPLLADGDSLPDRAAFSELFRRERYQQSVTTRTHQFIQTYVLQKVETVTAADVKLDSFIAVKGQRIKDAPLLATKVALKSPTSKLSGVVDSVDVARQTFGLMGLTFQVSDRTTFRSEDRQSVGLPDLSPGDKISVKCGGNDDGTWIAERIRRKKHGGKTKLEGRVDAIRTLDDGVRLVTMFGIEVLVPSDVRVSPLKQKGAARSRSARAVVARVLQGDVLETRRELYDLIADPNETANLVDERPDIAQELEGMLTAWTESLAGGATVAAGVVDVDPETLEQLRLMGYIE